MKTHPTPSADWFLSLLHGATDEQRARMAEVVSACAALGVNKTFRSGDIERGFLAGLAFARSERVYTRAELDKVVSTIEADIRHAEAEEKRASSHGSHSNALEWQYQAKGAAGARTRILALLQT